MCVAVLKQRSQNLFPDAPEKYFGLKEKKRKEKNKRKRKLGRIRALNGVKGEK